MFHSKYLAPDSLEDILAALHHYGGDAKVIAGGTDLIPQMRLGMSSPKILLDPIRLPRVGIGEANGDICLDARLTHARVIESPLLKQDYPALVNACLQVGGPPVRNRGTLAGNLANASPAADSALPLLVYDAQIVACQVAGERVIPLNEFFIAPGKTQLAQDEYIRLVRVPKLPPRTLTVFLKLGNRQAMAIAVASVAVRISLDEMGHVNQARLALGSVAPTPLRAYQAEAILESSTLDTGTILLAAQAAQQASSAISDLRASSGYRSRMVAVLTRRALEMIYAKLVHEDNHG